jgi:CheY-like chemotaxis protein
VLRSQPPYFPSNGTIPVGTVTHRAVTGRSIGMMRQAMHSLFARVADFLRRKNGSTTWPSSSPRGRSSMGPIAVVGLVTSDEDRRLLTGLCSRNRWPLLFTETCEDARIALHKLKAPVILCDRDLPGRGWRETVQDLASSPHRACIILVSEVVDSYLWNEVVRTGGYDVLSKPLREDDVVRAVRWAWWYWNSTPRTAAVPGKSQALGT